jgi:hypothetical protein
MFSDCSISIGIGIGNNGKGIPVVTISVLAKKKLSTEHYRLTSNICIILLKIAPYRFQ